ncbi:MAG: transcriptional regulator [Ignavibacteria bacterium]|jgi:DNA-binding transcriptional ArsR family regulator
MSKQLDHKKIDEVIHSRIRLSILAALATVDEMDFISLLNEVNTTKGNLSVHLTKLEIKRYVKVDKRFVDKKPLTTCKITKRGLNALKEYLDMVEEISKRTK